MNAGGGGSDPATKGSIIKRSETETETTETAMIQVISEIEELLGNEEEEGKQLLAPVKEDEEEDVVYVVISGKSNSNCSMDALLWTLNNAAAATGAETLVFLVHVFP